MCNVKVKSSAAIQQAVVFAYNAIMMGVDLLITSDATGEVLFHYENKAVQWIDGELARELLIV